MAVCSKAPVGSCCTEDRTGSPAYKYSKTNVYTANSCAEARKAYGITDNNPTVYNFPGGERQGVISQRYKKAPTVPRIPRIGGPLTTSQTDPYGRAPKPLPRAPIRPAATMPRCGVIYQGKGFACCCSGLAGCPHTGYVYTKDRPTCCRTFPTPGSRCYNNIQGQPHQGSLSSRFPGGPYTSPSYPQYTDINPKVINYPGGERQPERQPTVYKPVSPTMRPTSGTLPSAAGSDDNIPSRFGSQRSMPTVPTPSGDGGGTAEAPTGPDTAAPKAPTPGGIVDQLCPYFKWVPVGGTDCNMQVLAGVAIVGLGGALLIKMLKGR